MTTGLDPKTLDKILSAISEFAERELPESRLIALDERDESPADTIHKMCSSDHSRNGLPVTTRARCRPRRTVASPAPASLPLSRIFAREAALKVATDGLRWVHAGRGADPDFQISVGLPGILAAQEGLIDDMGVAAGVLYGREG